jgi:hypothetical protein
MKVKLTPVTCFFVEIEGQKLGKFDKISEWEGLTKIASEDGCIIFESGIDSPFDNIFSEIFSKHKESAKEFDVIKITPDLIPLPTEVIDSIRMPVGHIYQTPVEFGNANKKGGK